MKTTTEKIQIMTAYEEGKKIKAFCYPSGTFRNYKKGEPLEPSWAWDDTDYEIEEDHPMELMTNEELAEWLAKGKGFYTEDVNRNICQTSFIFKMEKAKEYASKSILIRYWNSDEWIKPSSDIYEKDCVAQF